MGRFWIVDGHNVIFAVPELRRLQVSGQGEEARRGLVDALRHLARTGKDHLLVVFDGGDAPRSRDVVREPLLEVAYAPRAPGGADERIIREAKALRQRGHRVTVVTNDVITLAAELPRDVDHLKVRRFWETYIEEREPRAGKLVEGDFSDVEKEMQEQVAAEGPEKTDTTAGVAGTSGAERRCAGKGAGKGVREDAPAEPKDALRERLRIKREKGRARHRRRLKRD